MKRRLLLVLAGVLMVLVALMAYQGVRTVAALREIRVDAESLSHQFRVGDTAGAEQTSRRIAADGKVAHAQTDNLLWDVAAHVPWVGRNVRAVQVLSRVVDETARSALPSALDVFSVVRREDGLRRRNGSFDLPAIKALAPDFASLSVRLQSAQDELSTIRPDELLSPLAGPVRDVQDKVGSIAGAARSGATATRLLPTMLGGAGPRSYLLVVQNNAEIRATGGLPGALALLDVRNGKIELGRQLSTADFSVTKTPALPVTAEERKLFGAGFGTDLRDLNLTPDYPRAAELFSATVRRSLGIKVDGVLAVDPVTLAAVMRATGPVRFGSEKLTAGNAVSTLLHGTYQRFPEPRRQDAYFAAAARAVFNGLVSGSSNPMGLLSQISEMADQRRVLVWSRFAGEEQQLRGTIVAGELPHDTGRAPMVGMYLNDSTAGKMDYYLDYRGGVSSRSCSASGVQTLGTGLRLTSSAPADVSTLAPYVTGFGQYAPKGSIRLNLRLYAPIGGEISSVSANGRPVKVDRLEHDGHQVAVVGLLLDPGGSIEIKADIRTRKGQTGDPVLQLTPGVAPRASVITSPSACG